MSEIRLCPVHGWLACTRGCEKDGKCAQQLLSIHFTRPIAAPLPTTAPKLGAVAQIKSDIKRIFGGNKPQTPHRITPLSDPKNIMHMVHELELEISQAIEAGELQQHLDHFTLMPPVRPQDFATLYFVMTLPVPNKAHAEQLIEQINVIKRNRKKNLPGA